MASINDSLDQNYLSRFLSNFQSNNFTIRMKTVGFLLLFVLAFPITMAVTCVALVLHFATRTPLINNPKAKRILISGGGMTKSLQLVRSLYLSGHSIILTEEYEYTAHRFSRFISRFCLCADTQNHKPYIESIIDIVKREKIDIFLPVSHSWNECADALLKQMLLQFNCETIHGDIDQLEKMSDKFKFANQARSLGLAVPKTYRITNPNQVIEFDFSKENCQFIMKSLGDDVITRWNRVKLPLPTKKQTMDYLKLLSIDEKHPWLMQEFIPGKEYCTHGTARNGELRLHTCCESSPWCLRYKHTDDKPMILEWVRQFCSKTNLTGQASFDFIESAENGQPYALECNPRTHSAITAFYNNSKVADAFLNNEQLLNGPIQPHLNARETYWLHNELWNLFNVRSVPQLKRQLELFMYGKEAVFDVEDPLPFFFHYTVHMPCVLLKNLVKPMPYTKVDCNLGLLL